MRLTKKVSMLGYTIGYVVQANMAEDGFDHEMYLGYVDIVNMLESSPNIIKNAKLKKTGCFSTRTPYSASGNTHGRYDIIGKECRLSDLPIIKFDSNWAMANCSYCRNMYCSNCLKCYEGGKAIYRQDNR